MIFRKAKKVLSTGFVCDHCLGRQFAQVLTGTNNAERGRSIRFALAMEYEEKAFKTDKSNFSGIKFRKRKMPDLDKRPECTVCGDIFDKLDFWAKKAAEKLKEYDFLTFVAGVKLNDDLVMKEENLWDKVDIEHAESVKSEINREFGMRLSDMLKKEVEHAMPDIMVVLNLQDYEIELDVRSVFIYGRYNKYSREIPQTRWDKYPISVEEIIGKPIKKAAKSDDYTLHGMGREDIDARCLGWRPFVMEIVVPRKRSLDLKELEKAVNKDKRIEIRDLRLSDKKEVILLKASKAQKTYLAKVEFENPVKGITKLKELKGKTIKQDTPNRVRHRRADIERKRKVSAISWKKIDDKTYELKITGDAGLYIKELVSGDEGRTKPSVSSVLNNKGIVKELDVVGFKV